VARQVRSGTRISGPNAAITLTQTQRRCKIMEVKKEQGEITGHLFYEIAISKF
jgi:hypothetical protein